MTKTGDVSDNSDVDFVEAVRLLKKNIAEAKDSAEINRILERAEPEVVQLTAGFNYLIAALEMAEGVPGAPFGRSEAHSLLHAMLVGVSEHPVWKYLRGVRSPRFSPSRNGETFSGIRMRAIVLALVRFYEKTERAPIAKAISTSRNYGGFGITRDEVKGWRRRASRNLTEAIDYYEALLPKEAARFGISIEEAAGLEFSELNPFSHRLPEAGR